MDAGVASGCRPQAFASRTAAERVQDGGWGPPEPLEISRLPVATRPPQPKASPLLPDAPRHRLRRGSLHPTPRRSQRRLTPSTRATTTIAPCRRRWRAATASCGRVASATSRVWFPASLAFARSLPRRVCTARSLAVVAARVLSGSGRSTCGPSRANLRHPGRGARSPSRCGAPPPRWSTSHFSAWVDFLHFATRPPRGGRARSSRA